MSLFPDFTDQRLRSPALPKRQRFFFLLISFILPLPCVVSVHGQESAPAGEAVAEAGDETAALPSEVLRMSRIREKIRMNSRLIDPFGFSMTSEKKAPEFIIEPEEEQDENEQERPPSGLTSRAVGLLPPHRHLSVEKPDCGSRKALSGRSLYSGADRRRYRKFDFFINRARWDSLSRCRYR